jgi:hypothetical protein
MTRRGRLLFVGDDWAEAHHDVEVMDAVGRRLAKAGCPREWRGWPGCTR